MKPIALTDGQRRHWRATFAYIDERLAEAERRLDPSAAPRPFAAHVADATLLQASVLRDYAARVRAEMLAALARAGIEPPAPRVSAVASARAHLRAAAIAAEELGTRAMRAYGPVPEELARELNLTSAALIDLLDAMDRYLAQAPQPRELPGQDALPALARAIRVHGLSELRGALDALAARRRSSLLEVAFFGRVNSGKSSLLNHILGRDALPVGARPITGMPIRIVHGAKAQGTAWFVDAQTETFDPARLAEFADAQQNPGNRRHVTALQLALPAPILARGIALIDTPGYGALGAGDPSPAALACDVAVLLLDAAAAPTAADAALVDALVRNGTHVLMVLAKADLLSAEDGVLASSYAQSALYAATRRLLPVHLVSIRGAAAKLADEWVEQVLGSCVRDRERHIEQSLAGKVARLREETIAALERRLVAVRTRAGDAGAIAAAQTALRDALTRFGRLRGQQEAAFAPVDEVAEQIVAQAAYNAAVVWQAEFLPTIDVTPMLAASLEGRAASAAAAIERRIAAARAALANALQTARAALADGPHIAELPRPAAPPRLNAAATIAVTQIARPALLPPIRALLAHSLRRRLRRLGVYEAVAVALVGHEDRLAAWRSAALSAIGRAFARQAGRIDAQLKKSAAADSAALRTEIERLRSLAGPAPLGPADAAIASDRVDGTQVRR